MNEKFYCSKNRLTFIANIIEKLADDDFYVNEIESLGTFKITKKDFYKIFDNVAKSKSYLEGGSYNYASFPEKAKSFLREPLKTSVFRGNFENAMF